MTNLHPAYLHIRDALPGDVDALAAIIRYAMPMDPQWDYRFPLRKQYPEDNYGYTRLMMKSFLEAQGVVVKVVTFPAPGLPEEDEVPAALAVWEVEPDKDKKYSLTPTGDKTARRDANFEHMAAFGSTTRAARETYFNSVYQSRQLHLRILATLPEFQRKGAGTALCSPLGHALYSSLGFTDIATITVQVKEEEEKLSIRVMVYPYEPVY
ncbi:Acyl-CoA N-acyltransferase [Cordyceps militaris CM01]|uniref:Acyl-CoA N-acyltransferase n=1 Tax=Cordyceps militaris (strain CM01) TaxID=983644 RepID=G3JT58_CORMM|nr:Acyl-CoA N-acyltransferase [Cordyceps militaris CM01]EGX88205.1 Acyl-CoA N-acyltransferase [Cordyceps militaris CM01]